MTPTAKPFREPAKVESLACPNCGGALTRAGFGAVVQVVCPYCGSELSAAEHGVLRIVQAVQRAHQPSLLPLHSRGTLDGIAWEVIGIVWREAVSEGIYPWQEFLLYNPYHGYRYLLFFLYDHHFALASPLAGAPDVQLARSQPRARFGGKVYRHFQTSPVRVTYVEGEFPWRVYVGDSARAYDYVDPPLGLSIEETPGADGADLNFSLVRHLDGTEVWKAFGLSGKAPAPTQVGALAPNPWREGRGTTWASMLLLLGLWGLLTLGYIATRSPKLLLDRESADFSPLIEELDVGSAARVTNLEVEFTAFPLNNSWGAAEVLLVHQGGSEIYGLNLEVDEWHGVDGGESWREGTATAVAELGGVPPGRYTLQVSPQAGDASTNTPGQGLRWHVTLREGVPLLRYVALPLLCILGFPLLLGLFGWQFERRRWANSDYAPEQ